MGSRTSDKNNRDVISNRRARRDYEIAETYEAGLALVGSEVKSLREGRASIREGWVEVRAGELWLVGVHIHEYPFANRHNHDPTRARKLLLNRREIDRIIGRIEQRGMTGVALRVFLKAGRFKVEIGLGKGRKHHDKRHLLRERDARREEQRRISRGDHD